MSTDKYTDSELGVSVDDLMKAMCSVLEPGEIARVRQFARESAIKRNRNTPYVHSGSATHQD